MPTFLPVADKTTVDAIKTSTDIILKYDLTEKVYGASQGNLPTGGANVVNITGSKGVAKIKFLRQGASDDTTYPNPKITVDGVAHSVCDGTKTLQTITQTYSGAGTVGRYYTAEFTIPFKNSLAVNNIGTVGCTYTAEWYLG